MHSEIQLMYVFGKSIAQRLDRMKSHLIELNTFLKSTFSISLLVIFLMLYPWTISIVKSTFSANNLPFIKAE